MPLKSQDAVPRFAYTHYTSRLKSTSICTVPRLDFPPTAEEQPMVELLTKLGELRSRMEAPRRLSHGPPLDAVIQLRSTPRPCFGTKKVRR
jgi:hypothetical protein